MNQKVKICICCIFVFLFIGICLLLFYLIFEKTIQIQLNQGQHPESVNIIPAIDLVIAIYKEPIEWIPNVIAILKKRCNNLRVFLYFKAARNDEEITSMVSKLSDNNIEIFYKYLPNVGLCDHTYAWHIVNVEMNEKEINHQKKRIVIFTTGSMPYIWLKKWIFYDLILKNLKMLFHVDNYNFKVLGFIVSLNISGGKFFYQPQEYRHELLQNGYEPIYKANQNQHTWHERVFPELSFPTYGVFKGVFAVTAKTIHQVPTDFYSRIINETATATNPDASYYTERTWYQLFHHFFKAS